MSTHTETLLTQASDRTRSRAWVTSAPVALAALVVLSTVARAVASFPRSTPRLLPDEFLYTGLARSLAHGQGFEIMGRSTSFPQLLESILIAPFWASNDTALSLHLTQAFHSVAMALAVVPVYLLARTLKLGKNLSLSCAAVAVFTPGLMYASYMTADAIGYLLALFAVLAAVRALQHPALASQAIFLGTAGLASFARMEYVLLFPVFVFAALVVERGHPLRTARRYALVSCLPLVVAPLALAITGGALLGRYESITGFGITGGTLVSSLSTGMVLAIAVGAAIVPGAVAWTTSTILAPTSREHAAFAAFAGPLVLGLVIASAVMSVETGSDRFFERYLIIAAPLTAIAFSCWATNGRPGRVVAMVTALAVVVAVARIPLAEQLVGQGSADSPTLLALSRLGGIIGLGNASLVAAIGVSIAALLAVAAAMSSRVPAALLLGVTIVSFAGLSVGAHAADLRASDRAYQATWTHDASWIEAAHPGPVVLVQTPGSSPFVSEFMSIWSPSVRRAVPLYGETYVAMFDGVDPNPATVGDDGTLLVDGAPLAGAALFATGNATALFDARDTTIADKYFTLVKPVDRVHLTVFAEGVRSNTTLAPVGKIAAYPTPAGLCTRATLLLTVPRGIPPTTLEFKRSSGTREQVVVRAGTVSRIEVVSGPRAGGALSFTTLLVGDRRPGPGIANVANAQVTAKSVSCQAGS